MMIFFCLNLYAQMSKKGYSLGYSGGGTTFTENATLTIDFRYNLTNKLRFSPSFTRMMRHYGYRGWMFDANVNYVIPFNKSFAVYPLAGVSWMFVNYKDRETKKTGDTDKYIGANIGFGCEYYFVDEIAIGLDIKYNLQKKFDQMMGAIRIAYLFQAN